MLHVPTAAEENLGAPASPFPTPLVKSQTRRRGAATFGTDSTLAPVGRFVTPIFRDR